jgi:hypothetical protein
MMPKKQRRIYDSLLSLWGITLALFLAVTTLLLSWNKYILLMQSDMNLFILSSLLAVITFGLFVAYATATHLELNLLRDYLGEDHVPRVMPRTYLAAFGLAIIFSVLLSITEKLFAYSIIMVFYNLFDLWGNWQVAQHIRPAIDDKLKTTKDTKQKQDLKTINDFYFGNPTLPRVVTIMFMNWIVVCLALSYMFTKNELLRNGGYILLVVNITIGEIVVHYWRFKSIYKLE